MTTMNKSTTVVAPTKASTTTTTTTTKQLTTRIATLNNQAVKYIDTNDFRLAMKTLHHAFVLAKDIMPTNDMADTTTATTTSDKVLLQMELNDSNSSHSSAGRSRRRRSGSSGCIRGRRSSSTTSHQSLSLSQHSTHTTIGEDCKDSEDEGAKKPIMPQQQRRRSSLINTMSSDHHHVEEAVDDESIPYTYLTPIDMVIPGGGDECEDGEECDFSGHDDDSDSDLNFDLSDSDWDTMIVILMFNLAITQHKKALSRYYKGGDEQVRRKKLLTKALELYKFCINIEATSRQQQQASAAAAGGGIQWDCIYAVVLLNNIGTIQYEFNNTNKSKKLFQRLLSLMIYLKENDADVECNEHEWDSFLMNATSSLLQNHSFAPAA